MHTLKACWRPGASLRWLPCALALSLGLAVSAGAGIPEPDAIYFGSVQVDGAAAPSGTVVRLLRGAGTGGEEIAESTIGTLEAGVFVLRIRLEASEGGAASAGTARIGDEATVLVQLDGDPEPGVEAALLHIGSRGRVTRMNLQAQSSAPTDIDSDGVPDFRDNCFLPNGGQGDSNGNGIGDPCEASVNRAVSDAMVEVGGIGNAADPATGLGAVDYAFSIVDTEVTNAQYLELLNAVAAEDPGGLYDERMASDPRGGIVRQGEFGAYAYEVKPNMGDKPVNFVSWMDAARFVNWLQNDQPNGAQDDSSTESGAFDLNVEAAELAAQAGEEGWSLPTEDEFYKAAYFDPTRSGCTPGSPGACYWLYPTRDDTSPTAATADSVGRVANSGVNVVNYASAASWNGVDGNVTTVSSAAATSFFSGSDLGGNVNEWLGADAEDDSRVVRGGSFLDDRFALESLAGSLDREDVLLDPLYSGPDVGFRVVQVPEPLATSLMLAALATLGALASRRRSFSARG